ncbi:MAG: response regulator [Bacteroidota bacterium]
MHNNLKIAVVDDHHLFRKGLKSTLEEDIFHGIVISEASNGKEAIDLAIQYQPQIMFMDVSMPVLNGYETSKRILSLFPIQRLLRLLHLMRSR